MNRPKGPEIKMPAVKMPKVLVDIYHDLDERHLLPLVAVLVIAIIAVPFLLGNSGGSENDGSEEAVATPSFAGGAKQSSLVVVNEDPRLRNYKQRLKHLSPRNPFEAPPEEDEASSSSTETLEEASSASESSASESGASSESAETASGGQPSSGSSPEATKTKATYFTYAIDVKVTPVTTAGGKPSDAKPTVRKGLPPLVMLPSRDTPALTYIGPSKDGKKAIMLVSNEVTGLFGDSICVVGGESCQLLALEPGLPETVVFGTEEKTYRITLNQIKVHTSDHLERAPLGNPQKSPKSDG